MEPHRIAFFHSPQTRSSGVFILLEELDAPYELKLVNMKAGAQRQPAFLAINPMGKVPAVLDGDALVTEQGAIFTFLADLFPAKNLAPAIGDPLRGPYLRWMFFYGSSFEPAVVDRAMKREPAPAAMSPYGSYDTVITTVRDALKRGPYLLGERMTAADILWAVALKWTVAFKVVDETPEIADYIARICARPAVMRAMEQDRVMAERHAAEAAATKA